MSMKNSHTHVASGSRGTKLVRSTGLDNSSSGDTSIKSLNPKMGGSKDNIAHSIKGASLAKQG